MVLRAVRRFASPAAEGRGNPSFGECGWGTLSVSASSSIEGRVMKLNQNAKRNERLGFTLARERRMFFILSPMSECGLFFNK